MTEVVDYASPGVLTDLADVRLSALEGLPDEAVEICGLAPSVVIQPGDAKELNVSAERFGENQIRPVSNLIGALLALDSTPLTVPRAPHRRVIGTCRHFAVLSCALLRHRGIPARARCGFATYFQPGKGVDHWIVEYWHTGDQRRVRIDAEIIGQSILEDPTDLNPGDFLTGGEAWAAFRSGDIDASQFGVHGTENWGPAEIRGNAVRDLAALNKVETLPWDEWGRMEASYKGETGAEYDELHDTIAAVRAAGDSSEVAKLYANKELRVPRELIR